MGTSPDILASNRDTVLSAFKYAEKINKNLFIKGNEKATAEYIFENQRIDAHEIVREFYENDRRVISITKKTKVGMDGLMIMVAVLMTTHSDDEFIVNFENVRIITGMSNADWEKDMKNKSPQCFKDNIFHHGQLHKANLKNMQNSLIIIDEIDTGNKEFQVLHCTLKEAGVLDVHHMKKNNNRFMFTSATMIKELYDLYCWGELHALYKMTIPQNYIGHIDFLNNGIIKEFYPLDTTEKAIKWIQEDIIQNYGNDYRVHIARVNQISVGILQDTCIRNGIIFYNHTSSDKLTSEETRELFDDPLQSHYVVGVRGLLRRANLISNKWKRRIGAVHELHTTTVDMNVQIQGLPGRMTGYWKDVIDGGHKTGPYRTNMRAIELYEKSFNNPFGPDDYHTSGFKKQGGKISAKPTMISAKNIDNLKPLNLPSGNNIGPLPFAHPTPFKTMELVKKFLLAILNRDIKLRAFHTVEGYQFSTRLNAHYNKNKSELLASDRLTLEDYNKIAIGFGLSKTKKGQNYLVYPVYENRNTTEVLYYVRYLKCV